VDAREGGEGLGSVCSRPDLELAAAAILGAGGRLGPPWQARRQDSGRGADGFLMRRRCGRAAG
jgi:hypothetical protein